MDAGGLSATRDATISCNHKQRAWMRTHTTCLHGIMYLVKQKHRQDALIVYMRWYECLLYQGRIRHKELVFNIGSEAGIVVWKYVCIFLEKKVNLMLVLLQKASMFSWSPIFRLGISFCPLPSSLYNKLNTALHNTRNFGVHTSFSFSLSFSFKTACPACPCVCSVVLLPPPPSSRDCSVKACILSSWNNNYTANI